MSNIDSHWRGWFQCWRWNPIQFKLRAEAKSIKHFLCVFEQKLHLTSLLDMMDDEWWTMTKIEIWRQADVIYLIKMKVMNSCRWKLLSCDLSFLTFLLSWYVICPSWDWQKSTRRWGWQWFLLRTHYDDCTDGNGVDFQMEEKINWPSGDWRDPFVRNKYSSAAHVV